MSKLNITIDNGVYSWYNVEESDFTGRVKYTKLLHDDVLVSFEVSLLHPKAFGLFHRDINTWVKYHEIQIGEETIVDCSSL